MKKFLLLIALIISGVGFVNAQQTTKNTIKDSEEPVTTILFSDDFEDNDLDGWRTFEKDNDENNWEVSDGKIYSYSYNNVVLNPDNYIVTTEMFEIDDATNLIWDVLPKNSSYPQDHYAAVISTDNENWIVVWEEILTSSIENTNRCVELAAYEGQSLYIGSRHYDTDGNIAEAVVIDNIILGNDLVQEPTQPEIVVGSIKILNYDGYSLQFTVTSVEPAECELTSYDGSPTDIIIPATITFGETEFAVTSIGEYVFEYCDNLTSIEIPSGVTSIGDHVFAYCDNLTSIEIPSGVTSIGESAFEGCLNLQSVSFGENSQLNSIGDWVFAFCNNLTSIEIPSGVTSIGELAFTECSRLTSIEIPSGVTSIGESAFTECSRLTSIEIPSGVTSIGDHVFGGCSNLTSIEIPSGVTSIGDYALSGCLNLQSVSFGENSQLASIGNSAFYDCNLKNIDIPNTVTSIGNHAFGECSKLKSIEIPENVEEIGLGIIIYCDDIEMITVDEDNVVFDSRNDCNAIIKTSENKLVCGCVNTIIPSSVTTIGNRAFMGSNITDIVVPNNVTSIEDYAFAVCFGLVSIAFEDGSQLSSIGNYAFGACSNLTSVTFGENSQLASIGESAFTECSRLTSIEIPSGVTSIGYGAFSNCSSLMNIYIGNDSQLSYIGTYAFYSCTNLNSLEIPESVNTIGDYLFGYDYTSELNYIICRKENPILLSDDLYLNDATIFVPESSVEDYENTYPWNNYTILPIDPASVNVTVNDEEAGSVIGAGNYCKSMEIRLMATPNRGYDFVGWKEDGEIVSTDSDYYFTLYGDRNLEAVFELSKYWHPDLHLYPNTMNMITEVKVDGELQNSTLLEVGAFCGDELRGSGRIQYNAAADKYIAYISVMGETDDLIKFKLYDHETYQELSHASLSVLPFETNAIVGTVTEPYLTEFSSTARVTVTVNPSDAGYVEGAGDYPIGSLVSLKATNYLPYLFESWTINGEVVGTTKTYNFVATESVNIKANFTCSQRTELSSGWNWTSFHTFIYGYNGLLALELSLGDYGLHIKNQNSFVTNHNGAWYGSLTSVNVEQMYIIRVSEDFTLVLNGLVVNPENYHITLTKNWKWIGYPVSVEMPVAEAFSGISPSDGDVIKTQGEFAMYNEGIGWSGNLTKMKPGKGYMYYNNSNSTKTLTYPTPSSGQSRSVETEDEITHWTADDTKYPSNMNMVAVLNVDGNELEANYEIAAFAGEELRGNARPIYIEALGRYMVFLTINGEESENLKFRCYNEETGEEFDLTENIMFSMNAVVGSVDEPYVFNCNINDEAKDTAEIEVYPNPVNAGEEINLGMTYDKVEIYNAIGAKIAEYNNVNKLAKIEIAGVYVIKATIGGDVKYNRLTVQ